MADPKYVRLADHMADSVLADIAGGSGFTLSGRDVKQFPEDPQAARFVRSRLVQGLLEPAGRAEFDEVQNANQAVAEAAGDLGMEQIPAQEGAIQEVAAQANRRLVEARVNAASTSGGDEEDEEDDSDGDTVNVDNLSSSELDSELRARGLPTNGNMEQKKARLRQQ